MQKDARLKTMEGEQPKDTVLNFMYQSIADTQAIIRAIDAKLGFILVVNLIPITNLGKMFDRIKDIILVPQCFYLLLTKLILTSLCLIAWITACISIYRGLTAIDNPSGHVKDFKIPGLKGTFYSGGLFKTKFFDALYNRRRLVSEKTCGEYKKDMPIDESEIFQELSFEKMKLAYIRDVKMKRQSCAFKSTAYWISLGVIIYVLFMKIFPILANRRLI